MRHKHTCALKDFKLVHHGDSGGVRRHWDPVEQLDSSTVLREFCRHRAPQRKNERDLRHGRRCGAHLAVEVFDRRTERREERSGDHCAQGDKHQLPLAELAEHLVHAVPGLAPTRGAALGRDRAPIVEFVSSEFFVASVPSPRSPHDVVHRVVRVAKIVVEIYAIGRPNGRDGRVEHPRGTPLGRTRGSKLLEGYGQGGHGADSWDAHELGHDPAPGAGRVVDDKGRLELCQALDKVRQHVERRGDYRVRHHLLRELPIGFHFQPLRNSPHRGEELPIIRPIVAEGRPRSLDLRPVLPTREELHPPPFARQALGESQHRI
mmetsp:Transcript_118882/g.336277  ORF Transcript_118882/g.336277 Transcript_118882/m.336277 type:complete len:320 (+) Transcript_118882:321-1280(+)